MKQKPLFQAVVTLTLLSTTTAPWAQNLSAALPSPDLASAPLYPLAVPNNGQPLPNLARITGFGRSFADRNHMTTSFRKLLGKTPTEFRR